MHQFRIDKANGVSKNPSIFIEAANRAIKLIAATVKPILAKITISPHNSNGRFRGLDFL